MIIFTKIWSFYKCVFSFLISTEQIQYCLMSNNFQLKWWTNIIIQSEMFNSIYFFQFLIVFCFLPLYFEFWKKIIEMFHLFGFEI